MGTAANNGSKGTPNRHTAGTNSARSEHGALACMPTGTAVHPADVGYLGSKDGYEATMETSGQDRRETEEGDETRERALSLRGM